MTSPSKPRVIIFDLLTGLLDSWTAWNKAAEIAISQYPDQSPSSDTPSQLGRTWRQNYLKITYGTGAYLPYADLVREAASKTNGLPHTAADILLNHYTEWIKPWPEVPETLQLLRARGYKLVVATNCSIDLGHAAAALCGGKELGEDIFDSVLTAEESGWYKPAKEAYFAALKTIGVGAEEALFVAGSARDVSGATGAGLRVVWHNHVGMEAHNDIKPEKEGKSLIEVLEGVVL